MEDRQSHGFVNVLLCCSSVLEPHIFPSKCVQSIEKYIHFIVKWRIYFIVGYYLLPTYLLVFNICCETPPLLAGKFTVNDWH